MTRISTILRLRCAVGCGFEKVVASVPGSCRMDPSFFLFATLAASVVLNGATIIFEVCFLLGRGIRWWIGEGCLGNVVRRKGTPRNAKSDVREIEGGPYRKKAAMF